LPPSRKATCIDIDLEARCIDVHLSPSELQETPGGTAALPARTDSSWLRRYARMVTSASQGAVS
jgi:dihydroxyacid dehydratase/phosphogluconate dehydratase